MSQGAAVVCGTGIPTLRWLAQVQQHLSPQTLTPSLNPACFFATLGAPQFQSHVIPPPKVAACLVGASKENDVRLKRGNLQSQKLHGVQLQEASRLGTTHSLWATNWGKRVIGGK